MIKYLEDFAERVVDYFDSKQKKTKDYKQDNSLPTENLEYVSYEIVPYHLNNFDEKTFSKFLSNFSYYSQRINFFVYWNNSNAHLIVSFPSVLENKFITTFYNFFPSSKIIKVSEKNFNPTEYFYTIDNFFKVENKKFFKDFFFLFKDIPSNDVGFVRYSLVLNSKGEVEYESLIELIRRWIKLFFWWIYYFLHQVFIWKPPQKKILSKKQQLETGIKWTAISVWVWWNKTFCGLAYKYFDDNLQFPMYKGEKEVFSQTKIEYFSSIYHIPTKNEKVPILSYINYKRLPPPPNLPVIDENTTVLWNADWADEKIKVWLKQEDKARHVYIIWKTWVWKSTLLSNMILSDLNHWKWLALIDPHWDLVDLVLKTVPKNRIEDVVLFDVSDINNPVGFNPFFKLSKCSEEEKEKIKDLVVSTVLSVFKKLYGYSWWPRLEYILRNVLLTLSDYPKANFLDIVRMLTDKKFRKQVVNQISDPVMKNFWENEFAKWSERFASEAISPILNKIWQFVSSNIVRNIFWQQESTLDIQEIMDTNKILLVNLSKWLIWEDNSALIGSFIVSQIQVETMQRAKLPMKERKHFTLYIDEFQNFATESFAVILSEARKYNLSLVVANQYISQIDENIQNAIFGNVWNLVVFNSWNQDAEVIVKQFKNQITIEDIVSIPRFKAYTKIMIDGISTDVFWLSTFPIDVEEKDLSYVEKIRALSNKKYTKPKKEVEEKISEILSKTKTTEIVENKVEKNNESKPDKNIEKKEENIHVKTDSQESWDIWDIFEWIVKLKFNYWLFIKTDKYEWLLHKKNIHLPEWIDWKEYYNIWDKVRVKLVQLKEVDWQVKAVFETIL